MLKVDAKLLIDIDGIFGRLTSAVGENTLRAAGFAGAAVFRDAVIKAAPEDTGLLQSEVIVARALDKSDTASVQTYVVRVRTSKNKYANTKSNVRKGRVTQAGQSLKTFDTTDAFYWRFLEYGSSRMRARPFIRPAYEAQKQQALQAMKTKLSEKISEALGTKK